MAITRAGLAAPIVAYLSRLRFPTLFVIACLLAAIDIVVPDVVPLVDELLLGLAVVLLGRMRKAVNPRPIRSI